MQTWNRVPAGGRTVVRDGPGVCDHVELSYPLVVVIFERSRNVGHCSTPAITTGGLPVGLRFDRRFEPAQKVLLPVCKAVKEVLRAGLWFF